MNIDIYNYLEKFDGSTKQRFYILYKLIYESTSKNIVEKLWAKLPSFYVDNNFIRIIPFKDHINIEIKTGISHGSELLAYKITPKGMLQIFHHQEIPEEILKTVFAEAFR